MSARWVVRRALLLGSGKELVVAVVSSQVNVCSHLESTVVMLDQCSIIWHLPFLYLYHYCTMWVFVNHFLVL